MLLFDSSTENGVLQLNFDRVCDENRFLPFFDPSSVQANGVLKLKMEASAEVLGNVAFFYFFNVLFFLIFL